MYKIGQTQERHGELLARQNKLLEELLRRKNMDINWKAVQAQEMHDLEEEMKVEVDATDSVETEPRGDKSEEEPDPVDKEQA